MSARDYDAGDESATLDARPDGSKHSVVPAAPTEPLSGRSTWARDQRTRLHEFVERRDWDGLRVHVAENYVAIWFSHPIGELPRVLEDVPHRTLSASIGGTVLLVLTLPRDGGGGRALTKLPPAIRAVAFAIGNRSSGNVKTSFRRFLPLITVFSKLQRENSRVSGGVLYPILLMQGALSAIYAGQFSTADLWLAQAARFESPEHAPFLRRDVAASRALLNAAFGDLLIAEEQLTAARSEERTDSWVEEGIHAVLEIAAVALRIRRDEWTPPADLLSIPWWQLQPHWPSAVWIISGGLLARGETDRLEQLLDRLELSGLEAAELSGLFGSVFPAVRTLLAATAGRPVPPLVRERLARHDDSIARVAKTVDAMSRNRLDQALALTFGDSGAMDDELASSFRRVLQASALLDGGRRSEALDLLERVLEHLDAARPLGPLYVPMNVAAVLAREPRLTGRAVRVIGIGAPKSPFDLTARERDLCRMLLGDLSLRQIADELGRTENTLKTHRRHLYGKLGVATREELRSLAVREPSLWDGFRPSRGRGSHEPESDDDHGRTGESAAG